MTQFSTRHLAAYERYKRAGHSYATLDETTLEGLAEDPAFARDVAGERTRRQLALQPPARRDRVTAERPLTLSLWSKIWDKLSDEILLVVKAVGEKAAERIRALEARTVALEQQVEELKARPSLEYVGIWNDREKYVRGACVSCQGSMWVAKIDNTARRPNSSPAHWQLAVKAGRPGRDNGHEQGAP